MVLGARHVLAVLSVGLPCVSSNLVSPVVVGQTFMASTFDPTQGSTPWSLVSHGIAEKLYTVNKQDVIVPQMAQSLSKVSELVWEVTLKFGYKFSDGTAVTAQHVADAFNELNSQNSAASSSLGKITVTAPETLKVRIASERPTHVMDAVLAEWVFVVYMKKGDGSHVFSGPYVPSNVTASQMTLLPNEYYPQASERPTILLKKYADGDALANALTAKELDVAFHLPIDRLTAVRATSGVSVKSFEVGYHYMMFHNMDKDLPLEDLKVRQAVDAVLNRNALTQALAGGHATRSLFPDYSPYFLDTSNMGADATAAATLLDEAGWTLNTATNKREKNGTPLTLRLVAYPHRPGLVIMQPVIAGQLEALGITVTQVLTGMAWSETADIISGRTFDLLLWAQHTLPAGDPKWFLNAFFRSDGGNNHAKISSSEIDALLDTLSNTEVHSARVTAAGAVHTKVREHVPVSNLVTPYWHVGLSARMSTYQPWGSDYYVIRPDLFVAQAPGVPPGGVVAAPLPANVLAVPAVQVALARPARAVTFTEVSAAFTAGTVVSSSVAGLPAVSFTVAAGGAPTEVTPSAGKPAGTKAFNMGITTDVAVFQLQNDRALFKVAYQLAMADKFSVNPYQVTGVTFTQQSGQTFGRRGAGLAVEPVTTYQEICPTQCAGNVPTPVVPGGSGDDDDNVVIIAVTVSVGAVVVAVLVVVLCLCCPCKKEDEREHPPAADREQPEEAPAQPEKEKSGKLNEPYPN